MPGTCIHQALLVLSTAVSFGTATACVSASPNQQGFAAARFSGRYATVTVHNTQWADMRVYIHDGNTEYRLGTVPAMASATFNVPRVISVPSVLRFLATPLTSDEPRASEPVSVFAGSAVEFTIGQSPVITTLFVRR
jgi:hypothetical protein